MKTKKITRVFLFKGKIVAQENSAKLWRIFLSHLTDLSKSHSLTEKGEV